ncbi:hypothetical protein KUCAC02_013049 [Chaenocephalus aceratus]|uniref:Uncharacterized protein n=1 Tax=Chaenocephalus aceratus TaxID=36190 RepID=A0ACB9XEI2_CHAAC|nr:hypothetical protein KUCAC02_013049 [Chaenocephalus aceratus]
MWVRKWLSEKRRERYGHYSTLLNELKTEDEKAFFNYTRLPRGLYDEENFRPPGRAHFICSVQHCGGGSIIKHAGVLRGVV